MAVQATEKANFYWWVEGGSHTFECVVDGINSILEWNEDNNTCTEDMQINYNPVIELIPDIIANETETVTISPQVNDPHGDPVTIVIDEPVGDDGVWVTGYDDTVLSKLSLFCSNSAGF